MEKHEKTAITVGCLITIAWLLLWGTIGYVMVHFIRKIW